MKVYQSISAFKTVKNSVVTTGTFDGVHEGHQIIINRLKQIASEIDGETVLLTFNPHPRMVLFPENKDLKLLNTLDEKIEKLEKAGIDHLIIHPFNKEFSQLSSLDFVRNILVNQFSTKKLVIGYNHRFGKNREGSFKHLKEFGYTYGFEVEEIPAQEVDNVNVSSTKIREALTQGNIKLANNFLGYAYNLVGTVVHGEKIGRTLGFPTANIVVDDKLKLIPAVGVYFVEVDFMEKKYKGMLNIGNKPTLNRHLDRSLELHILEFENEIYDQKISVSFIDKIREEVKFDSLEELKKQLEVDKKFVYEYVF
jgi:riboflavin kinase / FMN adenylyltransferase